MSSPAHSLLTLSKGPLFLHLYYVIIIIFCLKFKSSCSLSRTLNLFLEVSGILYFLRLFKNLPPLPPYPSQTLTSPAGRFLCLEVNLKICQLIFFLSFFFFFFSLSSTAGAKMWWFVLLQSLSFCFLLFQPPAGFPTWCWVIWCRCSKRLVFMSLADGLGKLHDVPAAQ